MSKYHRLENFNTNNASASDAHTKDDDSFTLFFDHHQQQQQQQQQNSSSDCHSHNDSSNNNVITQLVQGTNNNNNNNNSCYNITTLDTDDTTMEVPLLHSNNKDSEHSLHATTHTECHCKQPGFGANLTNKSTLDAKFKILLAITLCCIFMFIEFLGGYMAGSLAIMTDAAHLASDCISFVIGLAAIWLGSRPPDSKMSFGYKRMEVLGAIISILGIWILTSTLVMMAIERIYSNDFDLNANTMMVISGIGILINIVMIYILHGSSLTSHGHSHAHAKCTGHSFTNSHAYSDTFAHTQHSQSEQQTELYSDNNDCNASPVLRNGLKHTQNGDITQKLSDHHQHSHNDKNLNLRAAMIHVIGDLVQSIGVFLASILIKFYPNAKVADPLCTLLFSIIVIMTTVNLFKESVSILMDAVPRNIRLGELELELTCIEGVKSVHHLNVWNHTSNHSILMAHLVIDFLSDSNAILEKATNLACSSKYQIKHCTIQIERLTS